MLRMSAMTRKIFAASPMMSAAFPAKRNMRAAPPPITIGGRGPKRTLLAAARWAQQWNAITQTVEEWQGLKAVLAEHCATIGRDPAEIECSVNVMVPVDGDLGPALERVAAYRDAGADIVIMNLPHGAPTSSLEPLAESLRDLT